MPVNDMIENDTVLMKILNEIITANNYVAEHIKELQAKPKL